MRIRGIVIAALLMAIAGCWGGPERADKKAIAARYTAWRSALVEHRMSDGYELMAQGYRERYTFAEFVQYFGAAPEDYPALPPRYELTVEGTEDGSLAYLYPFANDWWQFRKGVELEWQKVAGQWYLTGEIKQFRN